MKLNEVNLYIQNRISLLAQGSYLLQVEYQSKTSHFKLIKN